MNELIKQIFELQNKASEWEQKEKEAKEEKENIEKEISSKKELLLDLMKQEESKETCFDDIFANIFSKENISYKDEKQVISYLKDHNYNDLITVKTTESLNKNNLKKALKTDNVLAEALESMTVKKLTEWVVVTDKENHMKMLEHIEENKKGE